MQTRRKTWFLQKQKKILPPLSMTLRPLLRTHITAQFMQDTKASPPKKKAEKRKPAKGQIEKK